MKNARIKRQGKTTLALIIALWIGTAGCIRSAFNQPVVLTSPGKTLVSSSPTAARQGTTTTQEASSTAAPSNSTPTISAQASQSPLPEVTLTAEDAQSQQIQLIFPMQTGNSWVYDYEGYSGDTKASWQVIDAMLEARQQENSFAMKVERSVTLTGGTPGKAFINPPQAQTFWYVVAGGRIYRQDTLDWSELDRSWLELPWPFPSEGCWFPDPAQRSSQAATLGQPGCRSAGMPARPVTIQTPAGLLDRCYHLDTPYNDGAVRLDFCEQVGIVGGEFNHNGEPYGYQYSLLAYSLQNK